MIGLRAIGAMTFVHVEINTTNIGDKVWEGKLCRFNPNSRSYRIYNHEIGTVVETRNNSFIETPPGCLLYTSPSPRDKRQSRMPSSA